MKQPRVAWVEEAALRVAEEAALPVGEGAEVTRVAEALAVFLEAAPLRAAVSRPVRNDPDR